MFFAMSIRNFPRNPKITLRKPCDESLATGQGLLGRGLIFGGSVHFELISLHQPNSLKYSPPLFSDRPEQGGEIFQSLDFLIFCYRGLKYSPLVLESPETRGGNNSRNSVDMRGEGVFRILRGGDGWWRRWVHEDWQGRRWVGHGLQGRRRVRGGDGFPQVECNSGYYPCRSVLTDLKQGGLLKISYNVYQRKGKPVTVSDAAEGSY